MSLLFSVLTVSGLRRRASLMSELEAAVARHQPELRGTEAVESANFKKLVSGEAMNVRQIYQSPEDIQTSCKLMFLSNNPPPAFKCGAAESRTLPSGGGGSGRSILMAGNGAEPRSFATSWGY